MAPPSDPEYDLIVLGGGPAGYVAALRAAELGMSTVVVEKDPQLGGTCLHRGCIPTKALLHTASLLDQIREASGFGVTVAEPELDLEKTHLYKNGVIDRNAKGIAHLFRRAGIESRHGRGRLLENGRIAIETNEGSQELSSRFLLLATGSQPQELELAPADGERVVNSDQILEASEVPSSLAILGAGAVGVEFASIFAAFGSQVTLIEMLPRILPLEDDEISKTLERVLRRRGIQILTDTRAESVETSGDSVLITLNSRDESSRLEVDKLLVAVGRSPRSAGLGLEEAGIEIDSRGFVAVDDHLRTTVQRIYAAGDLLSTPQLAHLASAEAIFAVENMAGLNPRPIDLDRVPSCTYCEPQVASVGLTEAQARCRYDNVGVAKANFAASGKAAILGKREGFVKVVREATNDELLGVHILGPEATELIAEAGLALSLESTTEEIFRTVHAHPTLSESVMEAARAATATEPRDG